MSRPAKPHGAAAAAPAVATTISAENLRKDLTAVSAMLSERSRTIALGIVAIWWTSEWSKAAEGPIAQAIDGEALLWPAFLGIVCLAFDFLQYLFGYWNTYIVNRGMEKSGQVSATMSRKAPLYLLRMAAFYIKMAVVAVAVVWFVYIVAHKGLQLF